MKKGIIVYQSKYGAAKKYAEWLQDMTNLWTELCVKCCKNLLLKKIPIHMNRG